MSRPDYDRTITPADDRRPVQVASWAGDDAISLDGRALPLAAASDLSEAIRDAVRVARCTPESVAPMLEMIAEQERLRAVLAATARPEPGLRVVGS